MGGVGLVFLVWSLRILMVEGTLWVTPLLLGLALAATEAVSPSSRSFNSSATGRLSKAT
jgi:hypothetical protein